jgi:phospholipase A1
LLDCSRIEDDAERLACYDEVLSRTSNEAAPAVKQPQDKRQYTAGNGSYLSQLWDLDENAPRDKYVIMTHRSNYILPFSYNSSPNADPIQEAIGQDVLENEVKFQISQKVKLWQDVLDKEMDLWFGYTQKSFWQLYNSQDSAPFRETNYEPEFLLNFRTNFRFLTMNARNVNVGFNHQSNGRSEPLSRSWNRIVANVGLERGSFTMLLKTWYRIPESRQEDDNPDIDEYMGPGEIWAYYFWKGHRFGAMLRNNLRLGHNRGALQLEWSFPLVKRVSGYIQYFTGYGESMVDYDHTVDRISAGFILRDWN